ncbi:TolC family protein [Chrysiogenes arsenatis]|uniref:TolC family protein n=1 Tax=Chrysiogenes arsenatis TaxID=309797 RepID=UPI000414DB38|nr:TolC family protein [Chrysiogenes arsenatis]
MLLPSLSFARVGRAVSVLLIGAILPLSVFSAPLLELSQAESIAIGRDLPRQQSEQIGQGYHTESRAARFFPDPQLIVGYEDAATMYEYSIGLRQEIPRWKRLDLRQEQLGHMAESAQYRANIATLDALRETRLAWFDLWYQLRAVDIIEHHATILGELSQVARERYAAGGLTQQQLILLDLEERMQRDRLLAAQENTEVTRAALARLIGAEVAEQNLPATLPTLPTLLALESLEALLPQHPAVLAMQSGISVAEKETEIAGQYYSSTMVDFLYARNNRNTETFGVMLTVPIPVFASARQGRQEAASRHMVEAARLERADLLRSMQSDIAVQHRRLSRLDERLQLYRSDILPQSRLASEAATASYQHSTDDFINLMRSTVYELENELSAVQLQVDRAKTVTRLLYYQDVQP